MGNIKSVRLSQVKGWILGGIRPRPDRWIGNSRRNATETAIRAN